MKKIYIIEVFNRDAQQIHNRFAFTKESDADNIKNKLEKIFDEIIESVKEYNEFLENLIENNPNLGDSYIFEEERKYIKKLMLIYPELKKVNPSFLDILFDSLIFVKYSINLYNNKIDYLK